MIYFFPKFIKGTLTGIHISVIWTADMALQTFVLFVKVPSNCQGASTSQT